MKDDVQPMKDGVAEQMDRVYLWDTMKKAQKKALKSF